MATITPNQKNRLLSLQTSLGQDVLIPTGFNGIEELSKLFEFKIAAVSTQQNITADQILGKSATLSITRPDSDPRVFNGIVASFSASYAVVQGLRAYELVLRPKLWLLTKTSDCKIFQNNTVLQITDSIFSENQITNYKKQAITGSHPSRDYCVQYMETDFDFLMRIWAEEGIYYYFDHKNDQHTLVLSDSINGYCDCQDNKVTHAPAVQNETIVITKWDNGSNFVSGKYTLNDYNFEQPSTNLIATTNTTLSNAQFKTWELYNYPGNYTQKSDGQNLSRTRMEEIEAAYAVSTGEGKYRGFMPGSKITMDTHEVKAEEKKNYVISYVEHQAFEETHLGTTTTPVSYANKFKTLPATTVFRPPLITRRPLIPGPQTAKVVGPSGEDIYCDKYGRIRVQFFWDRYGKNNENSSCWIRVAQVFAGANWGTIYTPRIGMEVIVAFLDGDPDQPLVVGSVYNADNMPPYTLPGSKTQSGIKTRSTTKGTSSTYNEMRIEDKKDSELFYFRAQKDFQREVMNNDTLSVSNDRTLTITKNLSETVSEGNMSSTVSKGNKSTTVSKGNVAMDINSGNYNLTLGTGSANVKCNGGSILLQAATSITLKVGSNQIVINQAGVTIKGTMVESTATGTSKTAGAIVQVNGSGMVKMAGGVVTIN